MSYLLTVLHFPEATESSQQRLEESSPRGRALLRPRTRAQTRLVRAATECGGSAGKTCLLTSCDTYDHNEDSRVLALSFATS
jgi:hypothetical protein